jgi:hypothetical protein
MAADTYLAPNKQLAAAMLSPLRTVLTAVIVLLVTLLAFWAVCLAMYFTVWQRQLQPLADLFHAALGAAATGPLAHVADWAHVITGWLHETLFVATGLASWHQLPSALPAALGDGVQAVLGEAAAPLRLLMLATQVYGVRMALLLGMLPLPALAYALTHADAKAERAIRRACAGRESANLYHQAKSMQFALLGGVLMVTLCLPLHVNPLLTMAAFAVGIVPLAWLQGTYYKKYR